MASAKPSDEAAELRKRAAEYRAKADEMRAVAASLKQFQTRTAVERAAADYDELARHAEKMAGQAGPRG